MADTTYEGWSNRETWAVNLWIANEEAYYDDIRTMAKLAKEHEYTDELPQRIEDYVEGLVLGDDPGASLATDLLTGALGRVDWREIAEAWLED